MDEWLIVLPIVSFGWGFIAGWLTKQKGTQKRVNEAYREGRYGD